MLTAHLVSLGGEVAFPDSITLTPSRLPELLCSLRI